MSDNKARGFLEGIVAEPDDDAARLVFADWLEEQGDYARAEFIRVQIERASLPAWEGREVFLWLREEALLKEHGDKWRAELPAIEGVTWHDFRRGFMASAAFESFAVLAKQAAACWSATPLDTALTRWPQQQDTAKALEPIPGLRRLIIRQNVLDQNELARFVLAPVLRTLRVLELPECSLGTRGFRRVLASPHLDKLKVLRVPFNAIGNRGVAALFKAKSLNSLEELDISERESYSHYAEDPVTDDTGVEALAGWPGLVRLRKLVLSGNDMRQAGLRALLRSAYAVGLKELVLRDNGVDGTALQEFAAAPKALQLDVLDLGENMLRDVGGEYLATAPCLRNLKVLKADRCELALLGSRALANAFFVESLRHLNVNDNSFGADALRSLLKNKPRALHTLHLHNNILGDEGVSHLAESPASNTLLDVDLSQNGLGDHALTALAKSKNLQQLLVLNLDGNRITQPAVLEKSPLGKRLAILKVTSHVDAKP